MDDFFRPRWFPTKLHVGQRTAGGHWVGEASGISQKALLNVCYCLSLFSYGVDTDLGVSCPQKKKE